MGMDTSAWQKMVQPITKDMSGFQADQAARLNATAAQNIASQQTQDLAKQLHTGGLLGYFTDSPNAIAADAPVRAQLAAVAASRAAGATPIAVPAAAATPAAAKTPAASAIAGSPDIEQAYQRGQTRYDTAHGQGLDAIIARYVEAKGSPASLGEVAYLADIATKNTKAQPKPITPAGGAIDDARTYGAMVYYSQMAAAQDEKDAAKANEARQSAVKDHQAYVLSLAKGINPVDTAVANGMNQSGQ